MALHYSNLVDISYIMYMHKFIIRRGKHDLIKYI